MGILKIRVEINKIEARKLVEKLKLKADCLRRSIKLINIQPRPRRKKNKTMEAYTSY